MTDIGRIISQLVPSRETLPHKTGIGGKLVPLHSSPLVVPSFNVLDDPHIVELLQIDNPLSAKHVREEVMQNMDRMLEAINRYIISELHFTGIRFYTETRANRVVAVIRDENTGEVLKVVPPRDLLEVAARLRHASGIMVNVTT